jgi:phytanoyl-CoA hydroxylase
MSFPTIDYVARLYGIEADSRIVDTPRSVSAEYQVHFLYLVMSPFMPNIPSDLESLKQAFIRDGFVVVPNYLSADEVEEMRDRLAAYHAHSSPDLVAGGAMKSLDRDDPWYRDYLLQGAHIPMMKCLIDDRLSPDNVSWISKPKGVARTFPHYDALGTYRLPPSGISLWIALDRIDLENGCLHYEKGSHIRDHANAYPLPDYDEQNPNVVAVEADPGDAVIHSAKVIHFSIDPVDFDRERNAMVFVYWGAGSEIDPARAAKSRSNAELFDVVI